MPGFGHWPELLIVLVIALIFFGPSRLPEAGSAVGKALREFRRATGEIEDAVFRQDEPDDYEEDSFFPHVPPAPDSAGETTITRSVDTLAMRRAARQEDAKVSLSTSAKSGTESS